MDTNGAGLLGAGNLIFTSSAGLLGRGDFELSSRLSVSLGFFL